MLETYILPGDTLTPECGARFSLVLDMHLTYATIFIGHPGYLRRVNAVGEMPVLAVSISHL